MKTLSIVAITITASAFLALADFASAQGVFQVSSTTFMDGDQLPIRTIFNRTRTTTKLTNGNFCAPNFRDIGGNQSPALSWTNVPRNTMSFAVVATDVTAGFNHWSMYNIPGTATRLPENAGAAVSTLTFGLQVVNEAYGTLGYGGPCPPRDGSTHDYEFVVYALSQELSSTDVPPDATHVQLLNALAQCMCVTAMAKITGTWTAGTQDGFPPTSPDQ
jgi:Raf kinase inhibitor-like YbhB/YbcL family protein